MTLNEHPMRKNSNQDCSLANMSTLASTDNKLRRVTVPELLLSDAFSLVVAALSHFANAEVVLLAC